MLEAPEDGRSITLEFVDGRVLELHVARVRTIEVRTTGPRDLRHRIRVFDCFGGCVQSLRFSDWARDLALGLDQGAQGDPEDDPPEDAVETECIGTFDALDAEALAALEALIPLEALWALGCVDWPRVRCLLEGSGIFRYRVINGRVLRDTLPL
jgi:hypothetical protein